MLQFIYEFSYNRMLMLKLYKIKGYRMDKRISFTSKQKIIELLTAGILLFLFGYLIINWSSIPEKIPSHFNASRVANAWS